jgi:hypothetical protein
VAAQLGALTMKIAYERWLASTNGDAFGALAWRALGELRAADPLR